MPLGAQNKDIGLWNDVLKRCDRKLGRWNIPYLSLGGIDPRQVNPLPSYRMRLFPSPKIIEKKINKLTRSFLWNRKRENRRYNKLVKWDIVTISRKHGGLDIKKLSLLPSAEMVMVEEKGLLTLVRVVLASHAGCCMEEELKSPPSAAQENKGND
uniref:Reverse transcriptase zinc-binding domain-containing protein n=1 Tax=Solanum lycopersicum TaxID=4081 RepID=A0A3Q7HLC7_SOLLC